MAWVARSDTQGPEAWVAQESLGGLGSAKRHPGTKRLGWHWALPSESDGLVSLGGLGRAKRHPGTNMLVYAYHRTLLIELRVAGDHSGLRELGVRAHQKSNSLGSSLDGRRTSGESHLYCSALNLRKLALAAGVRPGGTFGTGKTTETRDSTNTSPNGAGL